jgi:hypothetical protein
MSVVASAAIIVSMVGPAQAIDLDPLWDFQDPALSEKRFRAALTGASADDRIILQTQIARTYGLRRDFTTAREVLVSIEGEVAGASPEAQARYHLELGRTHASATHDAASRTAANRANARTRFQRAFDIAERAQLDYLAIDALHMMPFVETEPSKQIEWNERAVAFAERSSQPDARRWLGSLRNNIGYAKHLAGDYEGALREFRLSRAAFEAAGRVKQVRTADWMIAWTLRAQKKHAEALAIQLQLERDWLAAGETDPYVYEELEILYRAMGNQAEAERYAARLRALRK